MNILITGNIGYVGPCVINQLRSSYPDARLVGFDIGYFGNCITTADVLPECKVDLQCFGDMRKFSHQILKISTQSFTWLLYLIKCIGHNFAPRSISGVLVYDNSHTQ